MAPHQKFDDEVLNTTFTRPQTTDNSIEQSQYYNEDELWHLMEGIEYGEQARQFNRPFHLDIVGSSEYTPIMSRKSILHFSGNLVEKPFQLSSRMCKISFVKVVYAK